MELTCLKYVYLPHTTLKAIMTQSRDLTTGPVSLTLFRLAGPMTIGIIAVMSVALVDTYFVGQLGTTQLAALSFSFPVTLSISSMAIGLGSGAASVVSRMIGADDRDAAKRIVTDSLVLGVILVIILCVIGFITIRPLFLLLGAKGETLDFIVRYMQIWYASMPFLVIPMIANAIIRSVGDAFWPSAIMVASAILNITLTPLMIFGWGFIPAFDIEGAAWATLIARIFTFIIALLILIYREKLIEKTIPAFDILAKSWREVIVIAGPAAAGNMVNPVGITIVTAILAVVGESTVAAFGVATRIESFAAIPMLALSAAIGPVSGQNWGANKKGRITEALKFSYSICLGWAILLAVFLFYFGEWIVSQFSNDPTVIKEASLYLQIVPISLWGYGITVVSAGAFNAIGKSITGLGLYLIRTAAFYIPASWIISMFAESKGVFIAIALSNALAGIIIAVYSLWWFKNKSHT